MCSYLPFLRHPLHSPLHLKTSQEISARKIQQIQKKQKNLLLGPGAETKAIGHFHPFSIPLKQRQKRPDLSWFYAYVYVVASPQTHKQTHTHLQACTLWRFWTPWSITRHLHIHLFPCSQYKGNCAICLGSSVISEFQRFNANNVQRKLL